MGQVFEAIDERMREWLLGQRMFFVATAPLTGDGMLNLSPKGLDTFAVLGPHSVAYLDLTGSGIETVAHLRENGRITLLFCAFEGPPRLLRFYGRGRRASWGSTAAGPSSRRSPPASTNSRRISRATRRRAR